MRVVKDICNNARKRTKLNGERQRDSCGDVCAAEYPVNGQKLLVVTVYVSPNSPSDDSKSLIFSKMAGCSPSLSFWQGEVVRICQSY
jgi:hypothetical protein